MSDDKRTRLDDVDSILEMRRRHLELGLRLQALAVAALEEWERKLARGERLDMSATDAKALFDEGAKMERAALGKKDGDAPKAKLN